MAFNTQNAAINSNTEFNYVAFDECKTHTIEINTDDYRAQKLPDDLNSHLLSFLICDFKKTRGYLDQNLVSLQSISEIRIAHKNILRLVTVNKSFFEYLMKNMGPQFSHPAYTPLGKILLRLETPLELFNIPKLLPSLKQPNHPMHAASDTLSSEETHALIMGSRIFFAKLRDSLALDERSHPQILEEYRCDTFILKLLSIIFSIMIGIAAADIATAAGNSSTITGGNALERCLTLNYPQEIATQLGGCYWLTPTIALEGIFSLLLILFSTYLHYKNKGIHSLTRSLKNVAREGLMPAEVTEFIAEKALDFPKFVINPAAAQLIHMAENPHLYNRAPRTSYYGCLSRALNFLRRFWCCGC